MTVRELYEYAEKNGALDFNIYVPVEESGGWEENPTARIEDNEIAIY